MVKNIIYIFSFFLLSFFLFITLVTNGWLGRYEAPGEVTPISQPLDVLEKRVTDQLLVKENLSIQDPKMILFGDLHVHTTYSNDAFMLSLPMMAGEGTHPPADACDFARFCSSLDFWANTDHAEDLTQQDWQEIKDSVRQCNEAGGVSSSPDTVAFLGWEWSQIGGFGKPHYGHKNIILKGLEEDQIPSRPIAASSGLGFLSMPYADETYLSCAKTNGQKNS